MNEQDIPIDINTNKLLQWLVSRRHVEESWHKEIQSVREKINAAIQDMPEHAGILELLAGQHINYFHCLKIVECLKETEANTRNLFGSYSSQRMNDWKAIVSAYERKNLYLGEAAQILIRNVNYELPTMQHDLTKLEQSRGDLEKKIKDKERSATVILHDFNATCEKLGISGGGNTKKELLALIQTLPEIYKSVVHRLSESLPQLVELYEQFHAFHGVLTSESSSSQPRLVLIRHLIAHGNTTTYEYTYGDKPLTVEEPDLKHLAQRGGSGGDDSPSDDSAQEIDWGNLDAADEDFEVVEHYDVNSTDVFEDTGIVVQRSSHAAGDEALTVLDNPVTRNDFLNELTELEAFLAMREFEMSRPAESILALLQNAPAEVQMLTLEAVKASRHDIGEIVKDLKTRTDALHNIKHSPKHARNVLDGLRQKLEQVDRQRELAKSLRERVDENRLEAQKVREKLVTLTKNIKTLQKQIEETISKKYNGRVVHLVGVLNTL